MKPQFLARLGKMFGSTRLILSKTAVLGAAALGVFGLAGWQAQAQAAYRSQFTQVWATVPVGMTNTTVLGGPTNTVVFVNGAANAAFDVSGLPAGAGVAFRDAYGNPLPSSTQSTNLQIILSTTNIPEGIYNFTLNIGGVDTNGVAITNQFPFVLQAAHVWGGGGMGAAGFGVSNNWATAASWKGGVPASTNDVVFADSGAQTNLANYALGGAFNVGVDTSMTVASLRFAQSQYTNLTTTTNIAGSVTNVYVPTTNGLYHSIKIAPNAILAVTGTNGFRMMRDTVAEFGFAPDSTMGVSFAGTNGTLMVSNANANFALLLGSSEQPTLNMTNLGTFVCNVQRIGLEDFRAYPNYSALNAAYNAGRDGTNYTGLPRRMWANIYLARTNFIKATYVDPNNYTNEYTRSYALTLQNNEQAGNGSSVNTFFYLGRTNVFYLDSICFVGSSSASGNTGGTKFNPYAEKNATNPGVVFRGPDGVSRMSMFCVSDDAGTNMASSNVKSTTDFTYSGYSGNGSGSGYINLLADRLYVARDRTLITSNQSPNVQGDLTFGNGVVDVNTAWLGCQEHSNKINWPLYGAGAYLNYCQGRLFLTNNPYASAPSLFRVNGTLHLGYTADNNPPGSAQQYNTFGQVTIYSNVVMTVSNIVCDGGLNYYDGNGRKNTITINQGGNLVVSNTIGFPGDGAADFSAADPRGMRLDTLTMTAAKLTVFVNPAVTNVYTRSFLTPGTVASVIKVAALTNVSSFPVQIPIISYEGSVSPFLNADVSALGTNYYGYIINNSGASTVDLYVTTNSPNTLVWTGSHGSTWNITDQNWALAGTGTPTNFNLGDLVIFNDSSSVTNVIIDTSVVPGQTGAGVTISNSVNQYKFTGGTIAGTALVIKQGTNTVEFDATEQGPFNIMTGSLIGNGTLGNTTVYTNVFLTYSGTINGGITSTGMVVFSGTENGPISIQGGYLDNSGTLNTMLNQTITMAGGTAMTNEAYSTINVGTGLGASASQTWDVPYGSVLANFGTIYLYQPKLTVEGLLYGTGLIADPNGGGYDSGSGLTYVRIQSQGVISPGLAPVGSVTNMGLQCRFDFQNDPKNAPYGLGTVRIEVDFNNPQTNDVLNVDRWNNDTGVLLMTNINPSAGSFAAGQTFQVFNNANAGVPFNSIDTLGFCPYIMPYVPGPGLQWGVTNFNLQGSLSVVTPVMVWNGSGSGTWDTNGSTGNWKSGQVFVDNMGAVFDDTAAGTTYVNLTTNVAPDTYPQVGFTNYITNLDLTITTNIMIMSNQPAVFPGIVVNNSSKDYVIAGAGHIKGITGLYKTGSGKLTLLTSNDFIGNVIVDNGTLVVSNYNVMPNLVSLGIAGNGQMENDVVMDGGILSYVGTTNVSIINQFVLNPGGGTINVASSTNTLLFNTSQKQMVGAGTLTKTGPGTMAMYNSADNYTGGTVVNAGTLQLFGGALGTNTLTLNNTATLLLTNTLTMTNALNVAGPAVTIQSFGGTVSSNVWSAAWQGSGTALLNLTNELVFNGDLSAFSGTLSMGANSAVLQFNNATNKNPCLGSAAATFDLGSGGAVLQTLNGSNLTYNLGALSGGTNTVLSGRNSSSASPAGTIYSIGANGLSTTFSGRITNGADTVSIVKVGAGTLCLNGVSTYTGPTTVSGGALGGVGTIASPLTVAAGGTLAPGVTIGKFTVNNSVTLAGTVLMELNRTNALTNDELVVTGTLTAGGALVVTNVGPDIYNGTKFTLFSQPASGFTSVMLPNKNPAGTSTYSWNNTLATDGSITLVSGGLSSVNTNATNILCGVTNNVLTISWPADHLGWRLEVQTNPLATGLGTNWYTVPSSTNASSTSIPLDVNNPGVYYRLVYP